MMKLTKEKLQELDTLVMPSPLLNECNFLNEGKLKTGFFTTAMGVFDCQVSVLENGIKIDGHLPANTIKKLEYLDNSNEAIWLVLPGFFWFGGVTNNKRLAVQLTVANAILNAEDIMSKMPNYKRPSEQEIWKDVATRRNDHEST